MSYQDHDLTDRFITFLLGVWDDPMNNRDLEDWLVDNHPHIRVQGIGDMPFFLWFSESRGNPPSSKDEVSVSEQIMVFNWTMMTAWRILTDSQHLRELMSTR